jgi:U3 small nucleolar RNA-associated protein 20
MDLPALRENIENITASVFKLLHKYAAAGLSKGDNFDLVVAAFKVSFAWILQLNAIFIHKQGEYSVSI